MFLNDGYPDFETNSTFAQNLNFFAVASTNTITIRNISELEYVAVLSQDIKIRSLVYSADGRKLVICCYNGNKRYVLLWDQRAQATLECICVADIEGVLDVFSTHGDVRITFVCRWTGLVVSGIFLH